MMDKNLNINERGVTLQTVIITAIAGLMAAGAGVIIYNAIRSESSDIDARAGTARNVPSLFMTDADGNLVPATSIPANPFAVAGNLPPVIIPRIDQNVPIDTAGPKEVIIRYDNGSVDTRTIFPNGEAHGRIVFADGSSHEYRFLTDGSQTGTWRQVGGFTIVYVIDPLGIQTGTLMHEGGTMGEYTAGIDGIQTGTITYPPMGDKITFRREIKIAEDGLSSEVITTATLRIIRLGDPFVFEDMYTAVETYMREVFPDESVTEEFVSLKVNGMRTFHDGVREVYEDRPDGVLTGTRTYPDGRVEVFTRGHNGVTNGTVTHPDGQIEVYEAQPDGRVTGTRTYPDGVVEMYRIQRDGRQSGTRTHPNEVVEMYRIRNGVESGTRTYPDGRTEEY